MNYVIYYNNIKLLVNSKNYKTVFQISIMLGKSIPHFCYNKKLIIAGNCRNCLVEVKGLLKPLASCATPISENIAIFNKTPLRTQYITVFYSEMSRILNYHFIIISYNDHIYFDNNFFVLYCYFGLIIYGPFARIYHIYSVYGYDNFKDFIYKYFYDKLVTPNFLLLPIYFFLWFCKNFLFKSQRNEQNEKKEKNKKNE
jgi:hypothetical protein